VADHLTLLDSGTDPAGDVVAPGADPHQRATAELAVEQRFAVVPEWMLDSTVSDTAFRLYAILARYGNTSGVRMPGRALLARRLHRSVDTVDRALKELTAAGILSIERRSHDGRNLTNRYHLRTHDPDGAPGSSAEGDSRSFAATPTANLQAQDTGNRPGGRTVAAVPRRSSAARVAAALRPNQTFLPRHHLHPPHPRLRAHRRLPPVPRPAGRRRRTLDSARTDQAGPSTTQSTDAPSATWRPWPPRCRACAATSAGPRSAGPPPAWPPPSTSPPRSVAGLPSTPGMPCSSSPPIPRPAVLCAWPKPDPGGTTHNNPASPEPPTNKPSLTASKPPSPTPTTAPSSNTTPASSSPPKASPSPD